MAHNIEFQFQVPSPRSLVVSPSSSTNSSSNIKEKKKRKKKWSCSTTKRHNNLVLALSACGFLCISNLIWSAHTTTTKILLQRALSSNHEYNDNQPTILHTKPNPTLTSSTTTTAATAHNNNNNNNEEDQQHHHPANNNNSSSNNNSEIINNNKTTDNNNNSESSFSSSSASPDDDIDDDYPFTFGACLMTKDDNQILPEWLAYHYTVLPLRYLIIAVDPFSLTTPLPILQKYKELGMNIEFWDKQKRYWYDHRRKKTMKRKLFDPKNYTWDHRWQMRRQRQDCFYTACLRKFRSNLNISWVTLIDTDEYFTYNPKFVIEDSKKDIGKIRSNVPKKIGKQNETIAHYIANKHNNFDAKNNQSLCRVYPRLDFLASEEVNSTTFIKESIVLMPSDEDEEATTTTTTTSLLSSIMKNNTNNSFCHHFHSLCYQSHGTLGNKKFPGKALVNVLNYNGKYKVTNPHRPFGDRCDNSQFGSIQNKDAPFRIHHYTGSLETFLSRPERQKSGWIKRNFGDGKEIKGYDTSLNKWFIEFTKLVPGGLDKALELTYGLRSKAYEESMDIKRRIEQYNETIKPIFHWW